MEGLGDWDETEEKSFVEIKPGVYQARIGGTEEEAPNINNAKSSGRLQTSFTFTILDGDFRGRKVWKHFGLDDADQRGWFRGALAKLGYAWPTKAELPATLQALNGTYCEIRVTPPGKNSTSSSPNVYVNKALDSAELFEGDISEEELMGETPPPAPAPAAVRGRPTPANAPGAGNGRAATAPASTTTARTRAPIAPAAPVAQAAQVAEPQTAEAAEVQADAIVETKFDDSKINRGLKKQIQELAKEFGFEAEKYSSTTDLLADTAESLGIGGEFDDPAALFNAANEAADAATA